MVENEQRNERISIKLQLKVIFVIDKFFRMSNNVAATEFFVAAVGNIIQSKYSRIVDKYRKQFVLILELNSIAVDGKT